MRVFTLPYIPPRAPQVLDVIEKLFMHMFKGLETTYAKELAFIRAQYPFEPLQYKPLRLTFDEGIKLLQANGYPDVRDHRATFLSLLLRFSGFFHSYALAFPSCQHAVLKLFFSTPPRRSTRLPT